MKKLIWTFFECEHDGDVRNYEDDLYQSGAINISSELNYEAEEVEISFEVEDYDDFKIKFQETDSFGFQNNVS